MAAKKWNKVFEVGMAKTGTTSLGDAFKILGFRHKGWDPKLFDQCQNGDYEETFIVANEYEAFEDGPWHDFDLYKKFDKLFPNSKFILLERNINDWIRSHENHFSEKVNANNIKEKYLIKDYKSLKKQFEIDYCTHYKKVKDYFEDRQNDLLVMRICDGDGWEKLCSFLEIPIPQVAFPYSAKTETNFSCKIKKIFGVFLKQI